MLSFSLLQAMSLEQTVDLAIKHNNNLKKSYLDEKQSKLQKESVKTSRYGKIDLLGSYDHYNNARTLVPLPPMQIASSPTGAYEIPTTKDMFSIGLSYSIMLYDGNAQKNNYKISELSQANSILKTKLAKEELIYNIKTLYLTLLSLQKQLYATKQYTLSQKKLRDMIEQKYKLGSKSKLDFLKAQNSFILSKSNEDKIVANTEIIKANISLLIGGKEFDKAEDISVDIVNTKVYNHDIENLKKFKLIRFKTNIASKKLQKIESLYYPQISLNTYLGYNFGPNDTTNTSPLTNMTYINSGDFNYKSNWQIGLKFRWNIFDFGSRDAVLEKNRVAVQSMKIEEIQTKIEIEKNLKNANSKLELAKADYNSAKSEYGLLTEIVKAEVVKYENNMITLDDLLLSKAKKNVSYMKLISSKYEYQKIKYYIEYLYEKGE